MRILRKSIVENGRYIRSLLQKFTSCEKMSHLIVIGGGGGIMFGTDLLSKYFGLKARHCRAVYEIDHFHSNKHTT